LCALWFPHRSVLPFFLPVSHSHKAYFVSLPTWIHRLCPKKAYIWLYWPARVSRTIRSPVAICQHSPSEHVQRKHRWEERVSREQWDESPRPLRAYRAGHVPQMQANSLFVLSISSTEGKYDRPLPRCFAVRYNRERQGGSAALERETTGILTHAPGRSHTSVDICCLLQPRSSLSHRREGASRKSAGCLDWCPGEQAYREIGDAPPFYPPVSTIQGARRRAAMIETRRRGQKNSG